jgi:prephenate dehydrogenase
MKEDVSDFCSGEKEPGLANRAAGTTIGMIGGKGEMGRLFSRFFIDAGYRVITSDLGTEMSNKDVVESSNIVIFAVPLHRTVEIIKELVPLTRPAQLLLDLSSLKVAPVHEMLKSPASVVGLHPMFGGRISSFTGQTLVACPARVETPHWDRLRNLFVEKGVRVKECTPDEHDRMMSIIQVLFHMTTMLTGRVLRDAGIDIAETMDYTSPSYRMEMNLLGRIFAQNGELYSAITQMNPHTRNILGLLKEGLESYERWYDAGDLNAFVEDFKKSAVHLGGFSQRAYQESSAILDFAVKVANSHDND